MPKEIEQRNYIFFINKKEVARVDQNLQVKHTQPRNIFTHTHTY